MIAKSRRDSVGGGSSRILPRSQKTDMIQWLVIQWGGGGSSGKFFPVLFYPPHSVMFVGRDTHLSNTAKVTISWRKK